MTHGSFRQPVLGRHAPIAACVVLVVLALLPVRALGFTGWFAGLTTMLVAPITHPFARVGRLLIPAEVAQEKRSAETLAEQLDEEMARRTRVERENERLRATIEQLSRGAAVAPDVPVRQLVRQVIEPSPRLMRVRVDPADGVTPNAIATAAGVQLVGRVVEAEGRSVLIQAITARDAPKIRAEIGLTDDASAGRACLLAPGPDGTLRGEVEAAEATADPGAGVPPAAGDAGLRVGQTVRLSDDQWPRHAQMLVIGVVESVEPHERQPLRQVVTVRPTVDLHRLAEVVLRLPDIGRGGEASRPAQPTGRSGRGAGG